MRKIKLFENFIGEDHNMLYDIFEDIDNDYDVKISVLPVFDTVYNVNIQFEGGIRMEDFFNVVWNKIKMSRNMGFRTYDDLISKGGKSYYGRVNTFRRFTGGMRGVRDRSFELSDDVFCSEKGDWVDFYKKYKVSSASINFIKP
jgi:hypothetical protein